MALTLLMHALAAQPTQVPFFFISLSSERADRMRRLFGGTSTHVEWVKAVHGNTSAREFVHYQAQYNHLLKRNTPSELGCALSHVLALQRAEQYCVAHGLEMAVVLEDDVSAELLPLWPTTLEELANGLPDNWAIVQLQLIAQQREWAGLLAAWRRAPAAAVLQDRRRHFGTGAYLIHLRGMRQVLSLFVNPPLPASAASLASTMGAPELPAWEGAAGKVRLSLSADEVQADVHLLYSHAAPAYLATPPLLSCTHSTSSIEHYSASAPRPDRDPNL